MVDDHKDVENENAHYENVSCNELITSIDDEDNEGGERKDTGDDAEEKDEVDAQGVVLG